jgi:hypothetical protein
MTQTVVGGLLLALISGLSAAQQVSPSADVVPEIVVSVQPSSGVVPLDAEDGAAPYTFSVHTFDSQRWYAGAQLFVRLGQKRQIDRGNEETRIRGYVELTEDGLARYRLELSAHGKTVARTSAMIKVAPTK